jgi:hypothetical protein
MTVAHNPRDLNLLRGQGPQTLKPASRNPADWQGLAKDKDI